MKGGHHADNRRRILLDTNFILDTVVWRIDLFGELDRICDFAYNVAVPDKVLEELEKFMKQGGKKKEAANVAALILSLNHVDVIKTRGPGSADAWLVRLAQKKSDVVATQDQELKRRLKAKGVPVIVIREKGYLQLVER